MKLISTDERIVERAGNSIPEIVAAGGWEAFRDIESEVIRDVSAEDNIIIDAGGGAIIRPQNVGTLRRRGILFWLTACASTIAKRIGGDTQRPSLTGDKSFIEEIEEVMKTREPLYRAAAHHIVDTEGRAPHELAADILKQLRDE